MFFFVTTRGQKMVRDFGGGDGREWILLRMVGCLLILLPCYIPV